MLAYKVTDFHLLEGLSYKLKPDSCKLKPDCSIFKPDHLKNVNQIEH